MSTKTSRGSRLRQIRQGGEESTSPGEDNGGPELKADTKEEAEMPTADNSDSLATGPPASDGRVQAKPTIDPYVGRLERYELFCTNQSYFLVGCNKLNTAYRVLKMDRTLIERPLDTTPHNNTSSQPTQVIPSDSNASTTSDTQAMADAAHNSKPTLRPLSEFLTEDPNVYTQEEIHDMLDMIHDGNRLQREGTSPDGGDQDGGLKPIAKADGIVGFVRFLDCYYLTLITQSAEVGSIGGNEIYTIKNTETFPIKPAGRLPGASSEMDVHGDPSSVLLNMWNRGKRSVGLGLTNREIAELRYQGLYQVVDLTKNFFFSYTYDLTRSLQENFLSSTSQPFPPPPFKDMFAWNFFLTRELEGCSDSMSSFHWVMPIIHGAFLQRKLSDYGRSLNIILLARRSRHFAGTRYLKRGVSEQGKVANDVEHEQILHDESKASADGIFSSYLQVRGSIPTFWTQESSVTMPKPPIELNRVDPTYTATQLHFEDLLRRYGSPIVVLDLVKQSEKREREVRVGNEFRHAIDYINTSIDAAHKIRYCALDYSHISKHRHLDVPTSLNEVSTWAVNQTGFFCSAPQWKITEGGNIEPFSENDLNAGYTLPEKLSVPVFAMEQTGILRTNCIDCLDRTNVAQFSAGVEAMGQQLVVMGIRSNPKLDPSCNIVRVLIDMYVDIGDHIALQYGGSEAHKKVSTERSESIVGPIGKHKELLTSIRRYYSNAFTDRLKQDAMNLFLGYYVPYRHTIPLWEMETDYYLHNFHVRTGRGTSQSMKGFQLAFGVLDWSEDEKDRETDKESVFSSHSLRRSHHRTQSSNITTVMLEALANRQEDKNRRIQKVRDRCASQDQALSTWWKIAIQSNVQQRMWMQLGSSNVESEMPSRYERLYQPDTIAQFDVYFDRPWSTPVRRSHSAQHTADNENEVTEFRRIISSSRSEPSATGSASRGDLKSSEEKEQTEGNVSLSRFVDEHGYNPGSEPTLKMTVGHFQPSRNQDASKQDPPQQHPFIGDMKLESRTHQEEYLKNIAPNEDSSSPFRREAIEEFKESLYMLSLNADDVDGIRKLAESAHIGTRINSGPYKGLKHSTSAIEVATVIHEQFNAYENMRNRGELREGVALMDAELQRRGFYTEGLKTEVNTGWNRFTKAEKQYAECFSEASHFYKRSDFTTPDSLRLYTSYSPPEKELSSGDLSFVLGTRVDVPHKKVKPGHVDVANRSSNLVSRATRLGIPIKSHTEFVKSRSQPLFRFERRQEVPAGFEMINEDFFARKDNKFIVFNGAAIDSWHGTAPVTKTAGIETMLLGTFG